MSVSSKPDSRTPIQGGIVGGQLERRPPWMKIRIRTGENYRDLQNLVQEQRLHTVCEEARCPNIYECWERRSATIMILGDVCTRSCGFCAVKTGRPPGLDTMEPVRAANAVRVMGLKHCVITSVNRDELPDGGAGIWAETIRQIHRQVPECSVEVLIPDFQGDQKALDTVIEARPDILGHNMETVKRCYRRVRPQAGYEQSLEVLAYAKREGRLVKSGIMVGIGEQPEEVLELMADVRATGCQIFTIGQYLQPTKDHLPVDRYVSPEEFELYREKGLASGFKVVESGPLVRSSYHADEQATVLDALQSGNSPQELQ